MSGVVIHRSPLAKELAQKRRRPHQSPTAPTHVHTAHTHHLYTHSPTMSSGSGGKKRPLPSNGGKPVQKTTLLTLLKKKASPTPSSSSSATPQPKALRTEDGSAFYVCPLCEQGFPLAMMSHAESCTGKKDGGGKPAAGTGTGAGGGAAATAASATTPKPPALVVLDESPARPPAAAQPRKPAAPPTQPPAAAAPAGRNAFDVLRKAAAVQYRKEVFTLRREEDGKLDWAWHAASPRPASFSSAASSAAAETHGEQWWEKEIAMPGSKTARLLLRTNILPPQSHVAHHLPILDNIQVSVLKSSLQKNVRRSRGEAATKVALQLLHRAPLELFRRVPIIMFEDAVLHPAALVVFTWLMMAGETYVVDSALRKVLVRMLLEVAVGKGTDFCSREYNEALDPLEDVQEEDVGEEGLSPECQTLLRCIVARRHYGGMACDAHMLRSLGKLWRLRLGVQDGDTDQGKNAIPRALAPLVHCPGLRTTPAPSWRMPRPPTHPGHGLAPPLPLDYLSDAKLGEYLDSSRPWCRWLVWSVQTQCRPLPQSWLPSLVPPSSSQEKLLPLEDWPAVWRLAPLAPVGRGGEGDLPWSAIDFHVSGVIDDVYAQRLSPEERRSLASMGGGGKGGRVENEEEVVKGLLRSAMWTYSSSVTDKVSILRPVGARQKEEEDQGLRHVWDILKPLAHAFAQQFIKRRCSASSQ